MIGIQQSPINQVFTTQTQAQATRFIMSRILLLMEMELEPLNLRTYPEHMNLKTRMRILG